VKDVLLFSCVRAKDILCKCANRIRPSALHVTINSTNRVFQTLIATFNIRLLNTETWKLKEFMGDSNLPPYAIVSHTWGDDEVTYQDIISWASKRTKAGYTKTEYCCAQATGDGLEWAWIDT